MYTQYNGTGNSQYISANLNAGNHKIEWNATDVENGFYLLQLQTRDFLRRKNFC